MRPKFLNLTGTASALIVIRQIVGSWGLLDAKERDPWRVYSVRKNEILRFTQDDRRRRVQDDLSTF